MKPEFVDNRNDNTLVEALLNHLKWLELTYAQPVELSIATGYFNPDGFALIADQLEKLERIRLLMGAEPIPPPAKRRRHLGDPSGEEWDARQVKEALRAHARGLVSDRDLLGFTPDIDATVQRLITFLNSETIEVRRYEKRFLHGKAFIFADDEGVIAGSSNFTFGGLQSNLELNLGRYEPTPVRQVRQWFDDLWDEAVPYDLASIYEARYHEYDPYLIYLRVLWERYKHELEEERSADPRLPLTTFQNDGTFRAMRILDQYHGVLIADGVGLGKTYVGGELIRQAVEERRQRALLIAPAALRDGTWERFGNRYQLYLEKISFEELAGERQLGGDRGDYLQVAFNDYSLVVIDEAQAFRNPDAQRARALRNLLRGSPPKKLVLITATPVNNSLWDLYYVLNYFIKQDAAFADKGITSLKQRFADVQSQNPFDLRPDVLFDVLDVVTVRRTRNFVKKYYPNDRVVGHDGCEIPIRFPRPRVRRVDYDLEKALPGFLESFEQALMPEEAEPLLNMARYAPSRYLLTTPDEAKEAALVGLLRSGLLKRLESSTYAFGRTTEDMAKNHNTFLAALDKGYVLTAEGIEEWQETDNDEVYDRMTREGKAEPVSKYDLSSLRRDVKRDMDLLQQFAQRARTVSRHQDPKLGRLVQELVEIVQQAKREAIDEKDFGDKRKVVIFSYFADTVDWIYEHLKETVSEDSRLAPYRGRIVAVGRHEVQGASSRGAAIFGFAPDSTEAPPGQDKDLFDVLITTDVLAEGQNLQQCRNVINYDLPWNPMRLVQRHGRVDRIGSPHPDVFVRCFFPDKELNRMLELELRVRRKLAQAAASVGLESEVIPEAATGEVVFAQTRTEIEALRREEAYLFENAGEDPSAHSGEEYRQELRKGLELRGDEIKELPWAVGSGFKGGAQRGHFFCARVGDRVFLRFVPDGDTEIVRDTLGCLRTIACSEDTDRYMEDVLLKKVYEAWGRAQHNIYEEWTFATDPANLQPRVRPVFRRIAEHLRRYPPKGMDQAELDRNIDSLEAPWGARIERELRAAFEIGERELDPHAISSHLCEKIKELGLEPFSPPEPLPIIDEDDVQLVCWMLVDSAD